MDSNPAILPTYTGNPFLGPHPLRLGDPIFGRERELKILLNQLLSDRLLLLHSTSGCGKTSLVEAGISGELQERFRLYPTVSLKKTPGDAAGNTLTARLSRSLTAKPISTPRSGPEQKRAGDLEFFFFDQFEEVLTDKDIAEDERVAFFKTLGLALEPIHRWALFAIREDYLGDLQPYLRFLPSQLASRYRLTRLTVEAAIPAIRMEEKLPAGDLKRPPRTAFSLIAATELAQNLAKSGAEGEGAVIVEPVHLQVVCQYLWERITQHPITAIPQQDGTSNATVSAVLADYYQDAITHVPDAGKDTEFRLRKWFDEELIDAVRGQRLRVRVPVGSKTVSGVELDYLTNRYLIRDGQPWAPTTDRVVELAHDRLIAPIADSNKLYFTPFGQDWLKKARKFKADPQMTSLLLRGQDLRRAKTWAEGNAEKLDDAAKQFLAASKAEARRAKLLQMMTAVAIMAVIVAVAAIVFASRDRADAAQKVSDAKTEAAYTAQRATTMALTVQQKAQEDANKKIGDAKTEADATLARADALVAVAQARLVTAEGETLKQKRAAAAALTEKSLADGLANQAMLNKQAADADAAAQKKLAEQSLAASNSIQALSTAKEKTSLDQALRSLQLSATAGKSVLQPGDDQKNQIERAAEVTRSLLSRSLLTETLCLNGYIQSFGALNGTGKLIAVGENGNVYDEHSILPCAKNGSTQNLAVPRVSLLNRSNVSAIATDANTLVGGNFKGDIDLIHDGLYAPQTMKMRQQIIALTLSADGQFIGAASSFWSVGVWHFHDNVETPVLKWPGHGWDPLSWGRWYRLFNSFGNQKTNALALFVDETLPSRHVQGYLAEARNDGCLGLIQVRTGAVRVARPEVETHCNAGAPLTALAPSHDGKLLLTGANDGKVNVWWTGAQYGSWKDINSIPILSVTRADDSTSCGSRVTALAILANDTEMAAVGCPDGTIRLFDLSKARGLYSPATKFELLGILQGSLGSVTGLSFDTKSHTLYSHGVGSKVEVWYVPSAAGFHARVKLDQELNSIEASAKTATPDTLALKIKQLIDDVCSSSAVGAKLDQCSGTDHASPK